MQMEASMRHLVQAAGLSMLGLVVACSGSRTAPQGHDCFVVGGQGGSTVVVDLEPLYARYPHAPLNLQTCVRRDCSHEFREVGPKRVPITELNGFRVGAAHTVRVRFTARSQGRTVFAGATTVTLHRVHVNGKGCPPVTWYAHVSPHGETTLRQDHVTYDDMYLR
jgi:hypothetical protein